MRREITECIEAVREDLKGVIRRRRIGGAIASAAIWAPLSALLGIGAFASATTTLIERARKHRDKGEGKK